MNPRSIHTLSFAATLAMATGAGAQTLQDTAWVMNNQSNTTTRTAYDRFGQVLVRVRRDHAWGWGHSGLRMVNGLRGMIVGSQDVDATTPDVFDLTGFPGQSTGAQPDLQSGWQRGPFPHPVGQRTAIIRITFTAEETLPLDHDAYLGMRFHPGATNDGVRVFFTRYNNLSGLIYDQPGPRYRAVQDPNERVMYTVDESTWFVSNSALGQAWLVALVDVPAGVCTSVTNQVLQPLSNVEPGLANELSGRNPHARAGGRGDKPGFFYQHPEVANGTVALFLGRAAATPIPLHLIFPGASGAIGLDPATMVTVAVKAADSTGAASVSLDLPATVRSSIAGTDVNWMGLGITPALRLIASGSGLTRF